MKILILLIACMVVSQTNIAVGQNQRDVVNPEVFRQRVAELRRAQAKFPQLPVNVQDVPVSPDGTVHLPDLKNNLQTPEVTVRPNVSLKRVTEALGGKVLLSGRISDQKLTVQEVAPAATKAWRLERDYFDTVKDRPLFEAYQDFDKSVADFSSVSLATSSGLESREDLQENYQKLLEALAERRPLARSDEQIKSLCRQWSGLKELGKAIYGSALPSNYRPHVYEQILKNAESSVALVLKGTHEPHGSGVLIGDNLVLTCFHVYEKDPNPTQWKAWFDFTKSEPRNIPLDEYDVTKEIFRGKAHPTTSQVLDFVLLELAKKDGKPAGDHHRKAKLASTSPKLDEAIVVIGYPDRAQRTISDHAFVRFPFRVSEQDMQMVRMNVCTEFSQLPADWANFFKQFSESYLPTESGTANTEATYFHLFRIANANDEQISARPTIGADCDTFYGSSGSGVHRRIHEGIVGILRAGEDDNSGSIYTAGWQRHEEILPITEIIAQLDEQLDGWKATYGVQIVE
tara:strand:- start:18154 stop:19698 length:1545 start_codon:yes stop_codon:yes gene_type:complete